MSTPDMTKTGRLAPSPIINASSPQQSANRQRFAGLQRRFRSLDAVTRGSWRRAAATLNLMLGRTGRRKMSAANAYVMVNSARIAIGIGITDSVPTDLSPVVAYPDMTLEATLINGVFHVALVSAAFAHAVIIQSAKPEPGPKPTWADGSFKNTLVLDGLSAGQTVITDAITAMWGPQEVGMEICVRLVAVSATGVKIGSKDVSGLVQATAQAASAPKPDADKARNAA